MTWIKICGMTNLDDALIAADAGADAVGFVFYEKSPRYVTVETAREICSRLPENVEKVGVFVGPQPETVADISQRSSLTAAQIYPRAQVSLNDQFMQKVSCRVIPAITAEEIGEDEIRGFRVTNETRDRVMACLVDSGNSERPGGTGQKFDWKNTAEMMASIRLKIIVAGGLNSHNVGEAIALLKPWGVDVVSGVETRPGKKDPEKVRAFVRAVREIDRKAS